MAMSVRIDEFTGSGPTQTNGVTTVKFGLDDIAVSTTPVPTPSTGTNFSWIKSFKLDITNVGNSLTMSSAKVYKSASSPSGLELYYVTSHSSYTQATTPPTSSGSNNPSAPTMNSAASAVLPTSGSASSYITSASSTGVAGNFVEICVGVDATNTYAGASGSGLPNVVWAWTES